MDHPCKQCEGTGVWNLYPCMQCEGTGKDFDVAIDWLMAVRKYGIDEANRMFP